LVSLDYPLFSGCAFPVWQIFVLSVQEMSIFCLVKKDTNLHSSDYCLWHKVQFNSAAVL